MGINFPTTPIVGDLWPDPVFPGQPQYTWDVEKWTAGTVNVVGAVRYDTPQTLTDDVGVTAGQKTQARKNVYAAPFDALAYNGMQINGSMEVSQELGASSVTLTASGSYQAKYVVDGWGINGIGTYVVTAQQVDVRAFTGSDAMLGHTKALVVTVGTAQASLGATHHLTISTPIEGYRVARLGFGYPSPRSVTVAFVFIAAIAGTYSGSIRNGVASRSYPFSFTVPTPNLATYVTVTIPGDVTGTWATDNTVGLSLSVCLACGTTYAGPANAWAASNYIGVSGTANGVSSTSQVFYLSGVVVLPGIEAPSAARSPLIMRPYDQELVTCQRYFQTIDCSNGGLAVGQAIAIGRALAPIAYPGGPMRSFPTLTFSGTFAMWQANATALGSISITTSAPSSHATLLDGTTAAGLVVGNATMFLGQGAAAVKFDARL